MSGEADEFSQVGLLRLSAVAADPHVGAQHGLGGGRAEQDKGLRSDHVISASSHGRQALMWTRSGV